MSESDSAGTIFSATGAWRDLAGKVLADFRLIRKLGEGGMGQVYLAEQLSLRRRVAVKLLKSDLASVESSLKRFRAEAKTVAQLNHPNIVQVYAFGESGGLHYMAMEYVDGRNLRDYLRRQGPAPLALVLHVLHQVAQALQRAAEVGLVHRDIKPENILLTRRGEVKVADFGLSRMVHGEEAQRLTQTGTVIGTPLYMSPEQVEGRPLDCRSDIYSLGVTCYHLLAGRPPFEGENAFAVALQHLQTEPPPLKSLRPDLPEEVCAVVHRMMAKRPEERFASPAELLEAVVELQRRYCPSQSLTGQLAFSALSGEAQSATHTVTATTVSWPISARPRAVRRIFFWTAAVVVSLGLVFGLGVAIGKVRSRHLSAETNGLSEAEIGGESSLPRLPVGITTRDQEKALQVLVGVTEEPGKDTTKLRQGIQHRLDLLVLLLRAYEEEPKALDRAEKCCHDWIRSSVKGYVLIGEIGLAMVLAFRDKPAESNQLFLLALKHCPELQRPAYGMTPFLQPEWYRLVVRALEHNRINLSAQGKPMPPELADLLKKLRFRPRLVKPPD